MGQEGTVGLPTPTTPALLVRWNAGRWRALLYVT